MATTKVFSLKNFFLVMALALLYPFMVGTAFFFHSPSENKPTREKPAPSLDELSLGVLLARADDLSQKKGNNKALNSAIIIYNQVAEILKKEKAWEPLLAVQIKRALVFLDKDPQEDSLAYYALDLAIKDGVTHLGSSNLTLALAYHRLGVICNSMDYLEGAVWNYKKALEIRETYPDTIKRNIVLGYHNIGKAYLFMEMPDSALFFLEKSIELLSSPQAGVQDPKLKATTFQFAGLAYRKKGDLQKAKYCLQFAVDHFLTHESSWDQAPMLDEMSMLLREMEAYQEALSFSNLAEEKLLGIKEKNKEDYFNLVNIYNNRGYLYRKMGLLHKAEQIYEASIAINQQYPLRKESLSENYNNLGIVYNAKKENKKALLILEKAIAINEALNAPEVSLARNYDNMGDAYFGLHQYEEALQAYQTSISLFSGPERIDPSGLPILTGAVNLNKKYLLEPLESKAQTLYQLSLEKPEDSKWLSQSFESYQKLDTLIDLLRRDFDFVQSKESLAPKAKPIYEGAIQVCLALGQVNTSHTYLDAAFAFSQKSKSIILLEAIRNTDALQSIIIKDSLNRESNLRQQIDYWERKGMEKGLTQEVKQLVEGKLVQLGNERRRLIDGLEQLYPEYYQLKYNLRLATIAGNSQSLESNEAIVEYFLGDQQLYAFVLKKGGSYLVQESIDTPLSFWVDSLNQGISGRFVEVGIQAQEANQFYSEYAYKLYQKLIAPLNLDPGINKVSIIPDDILGYIPFDLLLKEKVPEPQLEQYGKYPFLLRDLIVSYQYAGSFLQDNPRHPNLGNREKFAVFAPSQEFEQVLTFNGSSADGVDRLSPLKYFKEEASFLSEQFSAIPFIGEDAKKHTFTDEAPQFDFMHFSGHGVVNDNDPNYSCLVFVEEPGQSNEHLLYVRELYNMNLKAEMVVLSACETAGGALRKGEGIISLARGFSQAGAKSIITTLWKVDQATKVQVMENFYRNLSEKMPKDEALRKAKIDYYTQASLDDDGGLSSHPFFWGAFIPIGDMEPVNIEKSNFLCGRNIGLCVTLLLGLIALFFYGFRNRTSIKT